MRREFIFLALILASAGCAKDNLEKEIDSDLIPIGIHGSINQTATRATAEGFVDGDAVGLFAVNYTDNNTHAGVLVNEGNQADNIKYIFDESNHKWAPVRPVYYKDINTHADLYLYYPYQANISEVNSAGFEVQKDQSTEATESSLGGYEASDILWGKGEDITPSQSAVSIALSHRLSAVQVSLKAGTGFGDGEFDNLEKSVIVTNTTRKAKINYATGEAEALGEPQQDGIVMCPQSNGDFRAVVIPQSVEAGTRLFSITIDGIAYGFKQNAKVDYVAGKQMNVEITINKKGHTGQYELVLSDTQIVPWTEDLNTHGGDARQYFVVNVTEPGTLGATIKAMGKNPDKIKNLKVVGNVRDDDFYFMRDSMAILEAVNMKESVIKASGKIIATTYRYDLESYHRYLLRYGESYYDDGINFRWIDEEDGRLPNNAFSGKTSLSYFVFPEYVRAIGYDSFFNTKLSGALIMPEGVVAIEDNAFRNTSIGSVVFNNSLVDIFDDAFHNCKSLSSSLILPETLKYIGSAAFCQCSFTGELHLPANLEFIGQSAFAGAGNFTGGLRIPDKITELYGNTFDNSGFNGLLDMNNLTKVDAFEFNMCGFSGELSIPDGMLIVPTYFIGQVDNLSSVKFPSTLKEIEENAFVGQNKLCCDIVLPEGLQVVGAQAFISCGSITGITFPSTIQTVQERAFTNCNNVSHIICNAVEPPTVLSGAFNGIAKDNVTVEVPAQSVKRYQAEPGWGDFKRIAAHYDFSLSRERMRALNGEMTRTYTLRAPANFAWSIDSKPDWVNVSPESGVGKTDVTVTVNEMARTSDQFEVNEGTFNQPIYKNYKGRAGEIVFKLNDKEYTCSMDVEQYDCDYKDGDVFNYNSASRGNGIDIIFIGEGYDAKDIANGVFTANANEGYSHFFNIEPYKTYKNYFNVYAVVTMSDESGIGTVNTVKDTKFGTYFTQNRIKVPAVEPCFAWARKADAGVDFTKALVINLMNTSTYEGICAMYGDGSAIAFCPVSQDAYPYDFRGIIQHEAGGHGFGKLGDEYIYHNAFIQTCRCIDGCDHPKGDDDTGSSYGYFKSLGWYKNLSMSGDATQVPWAHLIYHKKYSDYVDMYEGGYMHSRGVYRSEATSCMNNNIPYYSAISRQAMVERIMAIAGEEFTLEKFYANDSDAFGDHTKASFRIVDRTFSVDPKWNRGSEKGSVVYMGEHPEYSKIK